MALCCLRLPHVQTRTVLSSGSRLQNYACRYAVIAGSFVCRKPTNLFWLDRRDTYPAAGWQVLYRPPDQGDRWLAFWSAKNGFLGRSICGFFPLLATYTFLDITRLCTSSALAQQLNQAKSSGHKPRNNTESHHLDPTAQKVRAAHVQRRSNTARTTNTAAQNTQQKRKKR